VETQLQHSTYDVVQHGMWRRSANRGTCLRYKSHQLLPFEDFEIPGGNWENAALLGFRFSSMLLICSLSVPWSCPDPTLQRIYYIINQPHFNRHHFHQPHVLCAANIPHYRKQVRYQALRNTVNIQPYLSRRRHISLCKCKLRLGSAPDIRTGNVTIRSLCFAVLRLITNKSCSVIIRVFKKLFLSY
jgi:hypothetical protein